MWLAACLANGDVAAVEGRGKRFEVLLSVPLLAFEAYGGDTSTASQQPGFAGSKEGAVGMVVGSRAHLEDAAIATRHWYRNFLMRGFHLLVLFVAGGSVRDTQCGFKVLCFPALPLYDLKLSPCMLGASCGQNMSAVALPMWSCHDHFKTLQLALQSRYLPWPCNGALRRLTLHVQLFTRQAVRTLYSNQRLQRWCFDVELLFLARRCGVPVGEVAVTWREIPGAHLSVFSIIQM